MRLEDLQGKKIGSIGRWSNMCWITFGREVEILNYKGEKCKDREYSLHIQCPWRIRDEKGEILLGLNDMYEPATTIEWSEEFDWDQQGNNLFDEKCSTIFVGEVHVEQVELSPMNDLTILFSNRLRLECFVTISAREEGWRVFKRGEDYDLVFGGNFWEKQ
ncbi:MAG: hypothetical protein Q4F83_03055 [Eubacteriales bacterium]|nr:hypothetical protein [Eubacteriales bacterium]